MLVSDAAKARAEATFKRKEEQAREGAKAWAEYQAKSLAVAENMKRLRALRLAKEAADAPGSKDSKGNKKSPAQSRSSPSSKSSKSSMLGR
jgi:hypothetical protein